MLCPLAANVVEFSVIVTAPALRHDSAASQALNECWTTTSGAARNVRGTRACSVCPRLCSSTTNANAADTCSPSEHPTRASGTTKSMASIALDLKESYFHFNAIRQSGTGVIR